MKCAPLLFWTPLLALACADATPAEGPQASNPVPASNEVTVVTPENPAPPEAPAIPADKAEVGPTTPGPVAGIAATGPVAVTGPLAATEDDAKGESAPVDEPIEEAKAAPPPKAKNKADAQAQAEVLAKDRKAISDQEMLKLLDDTELSQDEFNTAFSAKKKSGVKLPGAPD